MKESLNLHERRALVISPHQDDAVISLGNHLRKYGEVDVVNIFTESTSHMLPDTPDDVEVVSAIRQSEDRAVADKYGFVFTNGNFPDSEIRGVAWNDYWADIDPRLMEDVREYLNDTVKDIDGTDAYIPAAFGLHPDHLVAHLAGMGTVKRLGKVAGFLYADQPYYGEANPVALHAHSRLNHSERIIIPFSSSEKSAMLNLYPSQLTPPRVERLSELGAEYAWPLSDSTHESSERVVKNPGVFTTPSWQHAAEQLRRNEDLQTYTISGEDENGDSSTVKLHSDVHTVNGDDVVFLRPVGAGYYDYLEPNGNGVCDEKALASMMDKAKGSGDVVWMSGIREDSALFTSLGQRARDTEGVLFRGQSSFIVDCDPKGFDAWASSLPGDIRRKVRRNGRKMDELIRDHDGTIDIVDADTTVLDDFFRLQAMRAEMSEGNLDAFAEDTTYVALLMDLTEKDLLRAVTVSADESVVGVMLFHEDRENGSLSIINQGFDNAYAPYSVGFLMQQQLISYAHKNSMQTVDYLCGAEAYKFDFTNRELRTYKYIENIGGLSDSQWENAERYVRGYVE